MKTCIHCGAFNGSVKKKPNEALKILHGRFSVTKDSEIEDLVHQFEHSCTISTEAEKALKDAVEELDPLKVHTIFSKIREEDISLFHMDSNLCRPVDLLIWQLPAPPLCIRPSVAVSQTVKNEDDLTVKLSEIAFFNKEVQNAISRGYATSKLIENWNMLQWTTAQYLNSETAGLPLNILGSKAIRSLSSRLKGKHGRFR